ncbi:uncharacterized protein BDR25DRAFT_194463, partial [Lindgomyces ingoldianus]
MPSNPNPTPPTLLAHPSNLPRSPAQPHLEEPPEPQDEPPEPHYTDDPPYDAEDQIPYPEPGSEQTLLPPPNFNPFFTLVEDTTTGEHYHPYVHYVFADDDPVIVTAAAMRGLGLDDTQYLPQNAPEGEEGQDTGAEGEVQDTAVESPLPPPIPGAKERFLIVDVGADGHTILDAQSLSAEWQVTNSGVRSAPSFDEEDAEQGYMLKVEGVEIPRKNKGKGKGEPGEGKLKEARDRAGGDVFGALDGLVSGIEGSLEVAGKIGG